VKLTEQLLNELSEDKEARDSVARVLSPAILEDLMNNSQLRLLLITALLKDVATKDDIKEVKEDLKRLDGDVKRLEHEVVDLKERVAKVEGTLNLFVKLFVAFNVPILVGIVSILLKLGK
jgi:Cdc6-like AAA superfamily ATPase